MYNNIINKIKFNLTNNKSEDKKYLLSQILEYSNDKYSDEITNEISSLLWDCLAEKEQKEYIKISGNEKFNINFFNKIDSYLKTNNLKKVFDILDFYFKNDLIINFDDDESIEYHSFSNPLEEALFDTYIGSDKNVKRIPDTYPIFKLYYLYGTLLYQFEDIPNAKIYLNKASEINPISVMPFFELSEISRFENDFDNFYNYTFKAFKFIYSSKNLGIAYRNFGLYYINKDNLKLATYLFLHSLKFDYNPTAINGLEYIKSKGFDVDSHKNDNYKDEFLANGIPLGPNQFIFSELDNLINKFNLELYPNVYSYFKNIYDDLTINNENFVDSKDEIYNLVYDNLTFHVRDLDLPENLINKYYIGKIIQERALVDASTKIGKMITNCRFAILSNHMADLSDFEHGTNWNLCTTNPDSIFKVLDIYKYKGKVQILLLHLIEDYWKDFISNDTINEDFVNKSRIIFRKSFNCASVPELTTKRWLQRCNFPVGLDPNGNFWEIK